MKRPIVIAVVGYIIGIIWGLYFNFSIVLFYMLLFIILTIIKIIYNMCFKSNKFSFYSVSRYYRYIKLFINKKVVLVIIVFSTISNIIVINKNEYYENIYNIPKKVEIIGKITSLNNPKDYENVYTIKVLIINNNITKNVNFYLNTKKNNEFDYGDIVRIKGEYSKPQGQRNYGGFSYKDYLKTLNIYGSINAKTVEVIKQNVGFDSGKEISNIQYNIKNTVRKYLSEDTSSIYFGLILGDTSLIDDDVKEQFKNSNMAHILAVSGMHVNYIIIGISMFFNKVLGKRKSKVITIAVLILYNGIVGFSPSIIRASFMAIIVLLGGVFYKKADTWTSIAISLFVILIYNPYLIMNIGLQFSFVGTVGIILFNKTVLKILNKKSDKKSKIKNIISISISSQIFILPLAIYHFNTFGLYFILSNLFLSFIIGPLIIYSFVFLVIIIFNIPIISFLITPIKFGIKLVLMISDISKLPLSKMYFRTPNIYEIVLFYILVLIFNAIYNSQTKKNKTNTAIRIKLTYQLIKYNIKRSKKKIIAISTIVCILVVSILYLIPKQLKIHFVDVGQGDCCFIETPGNKTILIDGGGSEFGNFDVGKSTLLPYILDRGYTKIDYIIISHFDTDHIGRNFNYNPRIKS
ncbi:MAG: ComEC/Rec2 family competence protein [Clostridia bacterium]|nr:ComEC/Rec2 family competence protein [Clostridia bacterium]